MNTERKFHQPPSDFAFPFIMYIMGKDTEDGTSIGRVFILNNMHEMESVVNSTNDGSYPSVLNFKITWISYRKGTRTWLKEARDATVQGWFGAHNGNIIPVHGDEIPLPVSEIYTIV